MENISNLLRILIQHILIFLEIMLVVLRVKHLVHWMNGIDVRITLNQKVRRFVLKPYLKQ